MGPGRSSVSRNKKVVQQGEFSCSRRVSHKRIHPSTVLLHAIGQWPHGAGTGCDEGCVAEPLAAYWPSSFRGETAPSALMSHASARHAGQLGWRCRADQGHSGEDKQWRASMAAHAAEAAAVRACCINAALWALMASCMARARIRAHAVILFCAFCLLSA